MNSLRQAVGRGGRNERADVRLVQHLLNRHLPGRRPSLKIDGIVGPHTLAAIHYFQARIVRLPAPDNRVDPDGPTLHALSLPPHIVHRLPPPRPAAPARVAAAPARAAPAAAPRSSTPQPAPRPAPAAPAASAGARPDGVIAWGAKVSPAFKQEVIAIAGRLQISPDFLMSCMAFESGESFSPSVRNAAGSGAVGLIQFMPSTAKALHTTPEALAAMSATGQLRYVERYFLPYKGRVRTIEDIYMTILFPRAIGQAADYTLFVKGTKAYKQNRGLDKDQDDRVTKFEAASAVRAKYVRGLKPGFIG